MGAKTWMLVYADASIPETLAARPDLDRARALDLAGRLFPAESLQPLPDGDLSRTSPRGRDICAGCYADVSVIAAEELAIDVPSKLPARFLDEARSRRVVLHAMHSVVDWFAYAIWQDGQLQRSLSLSPDRGVIEDLGERLAFETAYWAGHHPALDPDDEDPDEPYPLPFHPLELGDAALAELFGYVLEGPPERARFDPESVPLLSFRRARRQPWWAFWRTS